VGRYIYQLVIKFSLTGISMIWKNEILEFSSGTFGQMKKREGENLRLGVVAGA